MRRSALLALLLSALSLVAQASHARAQGAVPREDGFESGRSLALGLGNRASATTTSALAGNVANMSLKRAYDLETALTNVTGERTFGVGGAVVDSRTSRMAIGMMTRGVFGNRGRDYSGFDIKLGASMLLGERLSVGVAGRYTKFEAGQSDADGRPIGPHVKGFTLDAAVRLMLVQGLHLAAIGENLVDRGSSLVPQRAGGGVAYNYKGMLDVGFDLLVDTSTFAKAALLMGSGVEVVIAERFPIRAGYRGDLGREIHALTAGVAYQQPKVSIGFSMRQEFGPWAETFLLLSIMGHIQ